MERFKLEPETSIFESISPEILDQRIQQERAKIPVDPQVPSVAVYRSERGLRLRTQASHGTRDLSQHTLTSSDSDLQDLEEFCQWLIQIGGARVMIMFHRPNASPKATTIQELNDLIGTA